MVSLAILEIRVIPVGTDSASFSSSVTEAVRYLHNQGLKYQITPTSTVIEGDLDQLLHAARKIHQNVLQQEGIYRVITDISIDERIDKTMKMEQQMRTVQQSLKS